MRTMDRLRHACLALVPFAACLAPAGPVPAQGAPATAAVSQAETLLFETDHLARIKPPAVLVYAFRKLSNVDEGFSDQVRLELAPGAAGKTGATLHFLSGAHQHALPALEDAHGNPVLLGFLERDIAEMKRLTGGSASYFRKRIRMALANHAQMGTQSIVYHGKTVPATSIRIQPYLNDPLHARFESYVRKTYVFVVSEQVPGGLYQLRTTLDNGGGTTVAGPARVAVTRAAAAGTAAATPAGTALADVPEIDETLTLLDLSHPAR